MRNSNSKQNSTLVTQTLIGQRYEASMQKYSHALLRFQATSPLAGVWAGVGVGVGWGWGWSPLTLDGNSKNKNPALYQLCVSNDCRSSHTTCAEQGRSSPSQPNPSQTRPNDCCDTRRLAPRQRDAHTFLLDNEWSNKSLPSLRSGTTHDLFFFFF